MTIVKNITPEVTVIKPDKKKVITPATFESVTLTFTNRQEYMDVVSALTAFSRTDHNEGHAKIVRDYGLNRSKGIYKTVKSILARLP